MFFCRRKGFWSKPLDFLPIYPPLFWIIFASFTGGLESLGNLVEVVYIAIYITVQTYIQAIMAVFIKRGNLRAKLLNLFIVLPILFVICLRLLMPVLP